MPMRGAERSYSWKAGCHHLLPALRHGAGRAPAGLPPGQRRRAAARIPKGPVPPGRALPAGAAGARRAGRPAVGAALPARAARGIVPGLRRAIGRARGADAGRGVLRRDVCRRPDRPARLARAPLALRCGCRAAAVCRRPAALPPVGGRAGV
eukprot:scaffold28672_cov84-Isochrysis_galbana.AAC.2